MSATNWLIALCITTSFAAFITPTLFSLLAFSLDDFINHGKYWSLVSTLFIHANFIHLFGNMVFLYVFGNVVEKEIGKLKTVLAFFIGGVFSLLLTAPAYGFNTYLVGASGAIFTIVAIAVLVKPLKFSLLFLSPIGAVAILYFLYNILALKYAIQYDVAYLTHIMGFLIGLLIGAYRNPHWAKNLVVAIALAVIYIITLAVILKIL